MTIAEAYGALGLDAFTTTPEQVRIRFRDLIRANHPDKKPSHEEAQANEATRTIVEAYTLLREDGFPRATTHRRNYTAGTKAHYERQAAPESADPLAWLDDVWRESVRHKPPEVAISNALLRAMWWFIGGAAFAWLGGSVLFTGSLWWFGMIWLGIGLRFVWAGWTMGVEVARYWRVFKSVAAPATVAFTRRGVHRRVGTVIAAILGLVAAALIALRLFGTTSPG